MIITHAKHWYLTQMAVIKNIKGKRCNRVEKAQFNSRPDEKELKLVRLGELDRKNRSQ